MRKYSQESLQTIMIPKRIQLNKSNYYQMHIMNRHGVYDILMSTHAMPEYFFSENFSTIS